MPGQKVFQVITLHKDGEHRSYRISGDSIRPGEHFYNIYNGQELVAAIPTATLVLIVEEAAVPKA